MPTTAPWGRAGTTGGTAGLAPRSTTSGSYADTWPVAGSKTAASTNAESSGLDSAQGPVPSSVSCHGVARPFALSGSAGTIRAQSTSSGGGGAGAGEGLADGAGDGIPDGDGDGLPDGAGDGLPDGDADGEGEGWPWP